MKNILIALVFILTLPFSSNAQELSDSVISLYNSQVDTMTVEFTASVGTECYVAYYVNEPSIILQVALATNDIPLTDSVLSNDSITATIAIKGRTIIKCFQTLRNMPEGYSSDENKKLLNAIMPSIIASPALAYVVTKMRNENSNTVMKIKRVGANKVIELQNLLH